VNTSNHARRPLARTVLAVGGIGTLIAVAAAAHAAAGLIGGARGTLAGILVVAAVFGGCGLVSRARPRRKPGLTRPAPVRLPEPAQDGHEPVKSAA
jgi:hypothetical protein